MKLYVVRHGQSANNVAACYTGISDVPLTEKGIEDAKSIRPLLSTVTFDKVYTSDLSRAMVTAVTALPGCKYETTPLLRETDVGSISGVSYNEVTPEMRELIHEQGFAPFGGESRQAVFDRVKKFLDLVLAGGGENVIAFSHAGILKRILDVVLTVEIPRSLIWCGNCTVAIFEYKYDRWNLHSWINGR